MKRTIKFGTQMPATDFELARQTSVQADELGYYSISLVDHLYATGKRETPNVECLTTLTAIAALTRQIRLVPMVASMPWRPPALLAKMLTMIDIISGGRLIAGLGAGWLIEEHQTYGYHFLPNAERIQAFREGLRILKGMWTQDSVTVEGQYYQVRNAVNFPKAVQRPHPPILLGGGGELMLKVIGEEADIAQVSAPNTTGVAAAYRGNTMTLEEFQQRTAIMHRFAAAAGRDPGAIELCSMAAVTLTGSAAESEKILAEMARGRGLSGPDEVRRIARVLVGTADELKRELRDRIEKYGVTYWMVGFADARAREQFAHQVMPEFAA